MAQNQPTNIYTPPSARRQQQNSPAISVYTPPSARKTQQSSRTTSSYPRSQRYPVSRSSTSPTIGLIVEKSRPTKIEELYNKIYLDNTWGPYKFIKFDGLAHRVSYQTAFEPEQQLSSDPNIINFVLEKDQNNPNKFNFVTKYGAACPHACRLIVFLPTELAIKIMNERKTYFDDLRKISDTQYQSRYERFVKTKCDGDLAENLVMFRIGKKYINDDIKKILSDRSLNRTAPTRLGFTLDDCLYGCTWNLLKVLSEIPQFENYSIVLVEEKPFRQYVNYDINIPGGKRDRNEMPESAATREFLEETGINFAIPIKDLDPISTFNKYNIVFGNGVRFFRWDKNTDYYFQILPDKDYNIDTNDTKLSYIEVSYATTVNSTEKNTAPIGNIIVGSALDKELAQDPTIDESLLLTSTEKGPLISPIEEIPISSLSSKENLKLSSSGSIKNTPFKENLQTTISKENLKITPTKNLSATKNLNAITKENLKITPTKENLKTISSKENSKIFSTEDNINFAKPINPSPVTVIVQTK